MCCMDCLLDIDVQNRLIRGSIVCTMIGLIAHIVGIAADTWYSLLTQPETTSSDQVITKLIANIWGNETMCMLRLPSDNKSMKIARCDFTIGVEPSIVQTAEDYSRTMKAFAVVTAIMGVAAFAFSIWCVFHNRYHLKRLAGAMLVLTALCEVILLKVFYGWVYVGWNFVWKNHLPKEAMGMYGYGYYVAWSAAFMFAMGAFLIFLASRKHKSLPYSGSSGATNLAGETTSYSNPARIYGGSPRGGVESSSFGASELPSDRLGALATTPTGVSTQPYRESPRFLSDYYANASQVQQHELEQRRHHHHRKHSSSQPHRQGSRFEQLTKKLTLRDIDRPDDAEINLH